MQKKNQIPSSNHAAASAEGNIGDEQGSYGLIVGKAAVMTFCRQTGGSSRKPD